MKKNAKTAEVKKAEVKFVNGYEAISKTDKKAKDEKNDCVVRAVMNACGSSYDDAHKFVEETFDREPGKGTQLAAPGLIKLATAKGSSFFNGKKINFVGQHPDTVGILGGATEAQAAEASNGKDKKILLNMKYPKGGGRFAGFTVGKFLKQNPKGTFLLVVPGHALTLKDGALIDNENHNDELFKTQGRDQRKAEFIFEIK
jgi:hypothetical protein